MDNDELDYNMKLPMTDKRYLIDGLPMFNLSQWSRENEYHEPHRFKVGDVVRVTFTMEITELRQDCDGTSLYVLDNQIYGVPDDEDIRLATTEEASVF